MHNNDTTSNLAGNQSAILFTSALVQHLEKHPRLRFPGTYVGVRRVRPTGGLREEVLRRKHVYSKSEDNSAGGDDENGDEDDVWVPNVIDGSSSVRTAMDGENTKTNTASEIFAADAVDPKSIVYKVINSDGTERRMTKKEKKRLRYKLKNAKHDAIKEDKRIQHEERIKEAKKGKRERKRLKKLAWKKKQQLAKQELEGTKELEGATVEPKQENKTQQPEQTAGCNIKDDQSNTEPQTETNNSPSTPIIETFDEELAAMKGERKGIPPVMLTPAATCVALDLNVFKSSVTQERTVTVFDTDLSREWAIMLKQSMSPAEEYRGKEDMRPMAYMVVPEVWKRLRPDSMLDISDTANEEDRMDADGDKYEGEQTEENGSTLSASILSQHTLSLVRGPSPQFDSTAHLVFQHFHQHSNFHVACGARFGCDLLLYDGRRDERHSFAGLRVYSTGKDGRLPLPSPYDMTGFVRVMNTARKISLIATVVRDEDANTARIAIVDLCLEKVLTVETHIKKGNFEKRRSVEDTASGLSKKTKLD